jgi:hypothetical protein
VNQSERDPQQKRDRGDERAWGQRGYLARQVLQVNDKLLVKKFSETSIQVPGRDGGMVAVHKRTHLSG